MINNIPLILACVIIGVILYQSFFIAPSINKVHNQKEASKYLRYIWPKFFLIITILSSLSLLSIFLLSINKMIVTFFVISSILFMLVCYFIVPTINKSKDDSKIKLWTILHLLTVTLTFITLLLNISIIFYW